jgi:peroxiredoxin (alkyl hydroperoxide reductase subunit C)
MPIQPGDKFPALTVREGTADGPKDVDLGALLAGKRAIIFTLPGAFTPTCSKHHLPGFVAKFEELKEKGVDLIACLSVNDPFVMKAWGEEHHALGKIVMLGDGNAAVTRALGLDVDMSAAQMGVRCRRASLTVKDGVVESIEVEQPGKFEVSSADACLARL